MQARKSHKRVKARPSDDEDLREAAWWLLLLSWIIMFGLGLILGVWMCKR